MTTLASATFASLAVCGAREAMRPLRAFIELAAHRETVVDRPPAQQTGAAAATERRH